MYLKHIFSTLSDKELFKLEEQGVWKSWEDFQMVIVLNEHALSLPMSKCALDPKGRI